MAETAIGKGWIQVIPSFQNFKKAVAEVLGETEGPVKEQGRRWSDSLKSTLGGAVRTIGTGLVASFAAGTVAIASYTGEAIRASDATEKFASTLKFAGLGADKIEELKKATQKYADQTVYELSDIQNTTAQLAANGVEGYDRLAMAAGNLNAVAGGNVQTYKSVGQVITQTAGAGKLMTENWRQLTDAIPGAAGRLKDALKDAGAYTGDFMKAMSDGEITAQEFNQAILSLGFEEAAQEAATSTKTFENAWGNIEATITSGLVNLIEPFKGGITTAMAGFAESLDRGFKLAKGVLEILTSGEFNPESWGEGFKKDSPLISFFFDLREAASSFASALGPILGGIGGALGPLLSGLPVVGGAFAGLTGPVGLVVGLIAQMIANSASLRSALAGTFSKIMSAMQSLTPVFTTLANIVGRVATQLGDALAPVIVTVGDAVANLVAGVAPHLVPLLSAVGDAVTRLIPIIAGIINEIMNVVNAIMPALIPAFNSVIDVVGLVIAVLAPLVEMIASWLIPVIQQFAPVVVTVFTQVADFVKYAMNAVYAVISTVMAILSGDWSGAWEGIKSIVYNVWEAIKSLLSAGWEAIKGVFSASLGVIAAVWSAGWNKVKSFLSGTWEGIKNGVSSGLSSVVDYFKGLPGRILNALGNVGSMLYNAGASVIQGFLDGISSMFGSVKEKLGALTSWLPDWKGPAPVDAKILRPAGRLVIGGFNKGLEDGIPEIKSTLQGVTRRLPAYTPASFVNSTAPVPVVYVQNPFTGDYLLAQVDSRTDGKLAGGSRLRVRELAGV